MGDSGFLSRSYCEIRRHNPAGDVLYIDAEVTDKVREGAYWRVDFRQEARQQDGELSVQGTGSVLLPARS